MNIRELRNMFPALSRTVYGKQLVYFDNAATAQRSQSVIDKWTQLTIGANANIHRAVHKLAVDATDEYESTRDAVKEYINAAAREEIVFTSGTTGSINLVAFSFGETFVNKGRVRAPFQHCSVADALPEKRRCSEGLARGRGWPSES